MSTVARIIRKLKSFFPVMKGLAQVSFSQFGEDIIILKMLERYGVREVTYLDIGANDPICGSNTYNFYLRGHKGVLVEPYAELCTALKNRRPQDTVLNFGIGSEIEADADFFTFGPKHTPLNTFSKEDALQSEKQGFPIEKIYKVPLKNINNIISTHFGNKAPTIISLDVEGYDETILRSLDFERYQALLVCVETVSFAASGEWEKRLPILEFMASKGYFVYADTHVNTIFCSRREFDHILNAKK